MRGGETVKRILFVDDEPKVLDGLRRMLYPLRDEWQIVFASNGHQALQLLSESDYDVIVTDVRMPDMSGIELLQEVANQFPRVVRLVLSGTMDPAIRRIPPRWPTGACSNHAIPPRFAPQSKRLFAWARTLPEKLGKNRVTSVSSAPPPGARTSPAVCHSHPRQILPNPRPRMVCRRFPALRMSLPSALRVTVKT
jgi:CheY-like chemotaxis protein